MTNATAAANANQPDLIRIAAITDLDGLNGSLCMHVGCGAGLKNVKFYTMPVVELITQDIIYCDSCGDRIVSEEHEQKAGR